MSIKKYLNIAAVVFLMVILAVTIYIQTPHFRLILVNIITQQANNFLDGELEIEGLYGNIFTHLTFNELSITNGDEVIIYIDELQIKYNLATLLRKQITIEYLVINNVTVNLSHDNEEWNILNLFAASDRKEDEENNKEQTSIPDWKFVLTEMTVINGKVLINNDSSHLNDNQQKPADYIPSTIKNFNLDISFLYQKNLMELEVRNISFRADWDYNNKLEVLKITCTLRYDGVQTVLENFILETENLLVESNLTFLEPNLQASINFDIRNFNDFSYFAPNIASDRSLEMILNINSNENLLTSELSLSFSNREREEIKALVSMTNPFKEAIHKELNYDMNIVFSKFDPFMILADYHDSLSLNGSINLSGDSYEYHKGNINVLLHLENTIYSSYQSSIDTIKITNIQSDISLSDGSVRSNVSVLAEEIGSLKADFYIADLQNIIEADDILTASNYYINCTINDMDINKFVNDNSLHTDLNLILSLNRVDSTIDKPEGLKIDLEFLPSMIEDIDIDIFRIEGLITSDLFLVETFQIEIADNILELEGVASNTQPNDIRYKFNFPNIKPLTAFFMDIEKDISTQGMLQGTLSGYIDSLMINGSLEFTESNFEDYYCELIESSFDVIVYDSFLISDLKLSAQNLIIDQIELEQINSQINLTINQQHDLECNAIIEIEGKDDYHLNTDLELMLIEETIELKMALIARYEDLIWTTDTEKAHFIYDTDKISVDNFFIYSSNIHENKNDGVFESNIEEALDLEQHIYLNGHVYLHNKLDNNFIVSISNLDLTVLNIFLNDDTIQGGYLSSELFLTGNSYQPHLDGNLDVTGLHLNQIEELDLAIDFLYANNHTEEPDIFSGKMDIFHQNKEIVNLSLVSPISISLIEGYHIHEDKPHRLQLKTQPIELAIFSNLSDEINNLSGTFQADIEMNHSLQSISRFITTIIGSNDEHYSDEQDLEEYFINAKISVSEAGLQIPKLGTNYSNINIDAEGRNNRIDLNRFEVISGQGKLNLEGFTSFSDNMTPISLIITANNFPAINTSALNAIVNSDLTISGTIEKPRFSGSIVLPRGRIDLDKLLDNGTASSGEIPLLVKERERIQTESYPENDLPTPPHTTTIADQSPSLIEHAQGTITVSFPRNVWITSSDMNIELSSDLEIVKRNAHFELFGTINTVRGYYVFYGKRFQIETGEISFSGGHEINPNISLSALYNFRGVDMTRNSLRLLVSGTFEQLEISFELNNTAIEEADAISYILFGRSFEELTHGERSQATSQTMLLGGFIADRLAGVMVDTVSETFSLDLIEFRSDTAASQIGLEIGKYFTENLFISFKRDFNISDSKEPVIEELVLEYEISPFLYLQGKKSNNRDTGLDLIWRFKWQ